MGIKNEKGLFIKNPKRWRVPRKLKKQIPKNTPYCYTPTSGWKTLKGGGQGYTIKCCPFWEYRESDFGWCKLVKYNVLDQCKSCNISHGY